MRPDLGTIAAGMVRHEARGSACRRLDLPCAAIPRNALGALTRVFVLQPRNRADTVVEHFNLRRSPAVDPSNSLVRRFDDDCPVATETGKVSTGRYAGNVSGLPVAISNREP